MFGDFPTIETVEKQILDFPDSFSPQTWAHERGSTNEEHLSPEFTIGYSGEKKTRVPVPF